jgi:uncharacterized protein GlcG (DUF336 family)
MRTRSRSARPLAAAALLALVAACSREEPAPPPSQSQSPGATTTAGVASGVETPGTRAGKGCDRLPGEDALKKLVSDAPGRGQAGGFTGGMHEWAAVVNREGELCALAVSTAGDTPNEPAVAWPGSKAIAIAKAFTANGFSSDTTPMSTARLYTMSLPGHSLWSAANGNPLNAKCITAPSGKAPEGTVCGGTIAFGGGLPLYQGKTRIGGLGVSGDTPCADHEIAKRIREAAGLAPDKGNLADDIVYAGVDRPSIFQHPLCPNTWRNGEQLGEEGPLLTAGGIAQAKPPLSSAPMGAGSAPSRPANAASAGR